MTKSASFLHLSLSDSEFQQPLQRLHESRSARYDLVEHELRRVIWDGRTHREALVSVGRSPKGHFQKAVQHQLTVHYLPPIDDDSMIKFSMHHYNSKWFADSTPTHIDILWHQEAEARVPWESQGCSQEFLGLASGLSSDRWVLVFAAPFLMKI